MINLWIKFIKINITKNAKVLIPIKRKYCVLQMFCESLLRLLDHGSFPASRPSGARTGVQIHGSSIKSKLIFLRFMKADSLLSFLAIITFIFRNFMTNRLFTNIVVYFYSVAEIFGSIQLEKLKYVPCFLWDCII